MVSPEAEPVQRCHQHVWGLHIRIRSEVKKQFHQVTPAGFLALFISEHGHFVLDRIQDPLILQIFVKFVDLLHVVSNSAPLHARVELFDDFLSELVVIQGFSIVDD